jgi:hypothetical protein
MNFLTLHKFFIKGVVYQPHDKLRDGSMVNDHIADDRILELERDLVLFKELGVNTLCICLSHTKQQDWHD